MFKNLIVILACLVLAFTGLLYYGDATWFPDQPLPDFLAEDCVFDNKEIIERQQITETELMRIFVNYRPVSPGAILILPKRHVVGLEDLTAEEWAEAHQLIRVFQKRFEEVYGQKDYVLMVQNGYYGGQTVPHAHFHMIPRGNESTLMKKIQLWNIFLTESLGTRYPLTELQTQEMKARLK